MTTEDAIVIKGIRQGLLVKLREGVDWETALGELEARLNASAAFFREGRLALDVGPRELSRPELERVRDLLGAVRLELWAVMSTHEVTRIVAHDLGLVVDIDLPPAAREPKSAGEGAEEGYGDALVVRRTIRSGQRLRHPGHIVVIGDVNPGAEVIAGGDIVIWGHARGMLHAGALGEEGAVVCALNLAPNQLRIANRIARSPEGQRGRPTPEMASVAEGQIVAIPWSGSSRE